jgi:hypothetical protein
MYRATVVAIRVAAIIGNTSWNPLSVSSMTRASAASGACIAARAWLATGGSAAQAQRGDERLEQEQGKEEQQAELAEKCVLSDTLAVAEQLRVLQSDRGEYQECHEWRNERRPSGRAPMTHPADEPDEADRDQPDHRTGQDRPDEFRAGQRVGRCAAVG